MKLLSLACRYTNDEFNLKGQVVEVAAVIFEPDPKVVDDDGVAIRGESRRWGMFEALVAPVTGQYTGTPKGLSRCSEQIAEVDGSKRTHIEVYDSAPQMINGLRSFIGKNDAWPRPTPVGYRINDTITMLRSNAALPPFAQPLDISSLMFIPGVGHVPSLDECMVTLGLRHEGDPVVARRSLQEAQDAASVVSRFFT